MSKFQKDDKGVILPIKTTAPLPTKTKESATSKKEEGKPKSKSNKNKPYDDEAVAKAKAKLNKWLASKKIYDIRYKNNFDTYSLMYSENDIKTTHMNDSGELVEDMIPKKTGAQCLNIIMNKHADMMDNFPEAVCLPRASDDEKTAKTLNSVIPVILERCGFQTAWNRSALNKLVGGTGGYSVTWDMDAENGIGDIRIDKLDILNLVWQPHIENIQDSSDVFCLKMLDVETAKEMYPELEEAVSGTLGVEEYKTYDNNNKSNDSAIIVDHYYKKDGIIEFAKFCGDTVIFSTENNREEYPRGLYDHGKYPFILDPLFWMPDTPVGFGLVDVCRWPQYHLDMLKVDILKNVKVNSQTRNLYDSNAGINADDLADLKKEFIEADKINDVTRPLETKDIASGALSMYNALIDEMKETTGTNDASNGASAAGVTSGSAIAALQEAGGKISRDMNKQSYTAFVELCNMIIDLMRQFYSLPRYFRITGDGNKTEYVEFSNEDLQLQEIKSEENSATESAEENDNEIYSRLPIFDVKVKAQKQSPFAIAANNQMMMDMFNMGMFRAENVDASLIALEGMTFEGKDKIVSMLKEYQTINDTCEKLYNQVQMSQALLASKEASNAVMQPAEEGPALPQPATAPAVQGAEL